MSSRASSELTKSIWGKYNKQNIYKSNNKNYFIEF